MKTLCLKEALEYLLTLKHPIFADRKMSKHYIAKTCGVQPIMIDKWLSGQTRTIRFEAAESLKKEFDIVICDSDLGGQMTMKVLEDKLTID